MEKQRSHEISGVHLKELALRSWTVEFSDEQKTNPVLLIKDKDQVRGSIQMYQIKNIYSLPAFDSIEIEVLDPYISRYTTRNVEEWPNLDVEVLKHFEVDPRLYPSDIEYKSWLAGALTLQAPFSRDARLGAQQGEVLIPRPVEVSVTSTLKVFPKSFDGPSKTVDLCNWINDHGLVERVVAVLDRDQLGYLLLYKAEQEI